ncbi:mitochondrial 37S ribosomal protein mS38 Ecym_4728 [Eremothecium cymbalariae DBVPG|uniref:Small ribosomal subunit protein mS38 n=1 Tax=Eremothecium cymbalariae (strain CBS 270.75 / DBVPG 7215 / KCTC 17166 / NRRL Y-17582) TaxID=931890 RepID=G8JSM5_ERECY|nr:hypothetical protein Ecym_4728 [Eremothecium cymbalariae DBVPG\
MFSVARGLWKRSLPVGRQLCRSLSLQQYTCRNNQIPISTGMLMNIGRTGSSRLNIVVPDTWKVSIDMKEGVLKELEQEEMHMDSVMRKRRTKMKKHKLRKRRKKQRAERRKLSQGK